MTTTKGHEMSESEMSDETYEGWSNRETWALNLHISNNEGDYRYFVDQALELLDAEMDEEDATSDPKACSDAAWKFSEALRDWTEQVFEMVTEIGGDYGSASDEAKMLVADVGSHWRIDYLEIAQHWVQDAYDEIQRSSSVEA